MAVPSQANIRNLLLAAVGPADFAQLSPLLTQVELTAGQTLIEPEQPILHSWFPEHGVCSLIAATAQGRQIEVAVIGRDGLVDTAVVHGTDRTPLQCIVQISGYGWRIRAESLRRIAGECPALDKVLQAYAQTVFVQVAQSALANASHTIGQRLARWLLMSHDRLGEPEIRLTHERLSLMLGVRRAGVTVAIQTLESAGVVTARRGVITILNRETLEGYAADSYGTAEAEYERLIGRRIN